VIITTRTYLVRVRDAVVMSSLFLLEVHDTDISRLAVAPALRPDFLVSVLVFPQLREVSICR